MSIYPAHHTDSLANLLLKPPGDVEVAFSVFFLSLRCRFQRFPDQKNSTVSGTESEVFRQDVLVYASRVASVLGDVWVPFCSRGGEPDHVLNIASRIAFAPLSSDQHFLLPSCVEEKYVVDYASHQGVDKKLMWVHWEAGNRAHEKHLLCSSVERRTFFRARSLRWRLRQGNSSRMLERATTLCFMGDLDAFAYFRRLKRLGGETRLLHSEHRLRQVNVTQSLRFQAHTSVLFEPEILKGNDDLKLLRHGELCTHYPKGGIWKPDKDYTVFCPMPGKGGRCILVNPITKKRHRSEAKGGLAPISTNAFFNLGVNCVSLQCLKEYELTKTILLSTFPPSLSEIILRYSDLWLQVQMTLVYAIMGNNLASSSFHIEAAERIFPECTEEVGLRIERVSAARKLKRKRVAGGERKNRKLIFRQETNPEKLVIPMFSSYTMYTRAVNNGA